MIAKLLKAVHDKTRSFIGSWAYFIGSVMADGYIDRMEEFMEEEGEESVELEKDEDHGPN